MKRIPNLESAIIPQSKILNYLLNPLHRSGKSKARFFMRHGFTTENFQSLVKALVHHAKENEVVKEEKTKFGSRLIVEGKMLAPDGVNLLVRSVWFIEAEENAPRFVTSYPLKKRRI